MRAASEGDDDHRGGFRDDATGGGFPRRRASLRRGVQLAKAEQPRHLLTSFRRASFEVAVFGAESPVDRALIASLVDASQRADAEQVSVAAAKSPPAINLAAVGNPARLRPAVIDAEIARLRRAGAPLDGARVSASVSDAQAAVPRRRLASLDEASPTAAVRSAKAKPGVPLAAPLVAAKLSTPVLGTRAVVVRGLAASVHRAPLTAAVRDAE